MQPINYMAPQQMPTPDAFAPVAQGFQLGSAIVQQRQQQVEAEQAEALQEQMQADFGALGASPSPAAVARLMVKYPQISEQLKRGYDALSSEQQKASTAQVGQVYSAIRAGRPDLAKQMITDGITAAENSGDVEAANASKAMLRLLDEAPQAAELTGATFLAAALGPDKFADTYGKLGSERRADEVQGLEVAKKGAEVFKAQVEAAYSEQIAQAGIKKSAAEVSNLYSQIQDRAARQRLDEERLALDTAELMRKVSDPTARLTADSIKIVNTAAADSASNAQAADKAQELAKKFEKAGQGGGRYGSAKEFLAQVTGSEDEYSLLRKEYIRLRNSEAIRTLPPGPATDRDIALMLEGYPSPDADAATMASFLRGVSKANKIAAATNEAKAEWLAQNGTLTRAANPITIGGDEIAPGTTFAEYAKRKAAELSTSQQPATQQSALPSQPQQVSAPPEGALIRNKVDGKLYRVVNGQPVEVR